MFGFLKNKLKDAINKFSKKAEEEAEIEKPIRADEENPEMKKVRVAEESKGFLGLFKKKKTIEEVKELAAHHDLICLSETYINCKERLLWKCQNGHIFKRPFDKVLNNNRWSCPEC